MTKCFWVHSNPDTASPYRKSSQLSCSGDVKGSSSLIDWEGEYWVKTQESDFLTPAVYTESKRNNVLYLRQKIHINGQDIQQNSKNLIFWPFLYFLHPANSPWSFLEYLIVSLSYIYCTPTSTKKLKRFKEPILRNMGLWQKAKNLQTIKTYWGILGMSR